METGIIFWPVSLLATRFKYFIGAPREIFRFAAARATMLSLPEHYSWQGLVRVVFKLPSY